MKRSSVISMIAGLGVFSPEAFDKYRPTTIKPPKVINDFVLERIQKAEKKRQRRNAKRISDQLSIKNRSK